jgi:glucan phosphorylase
MLRDNFYHSDPFLCLPDSESYSECKKKVDAAFCEKSLWSKIAILNTARIFGGEIIGRPSFGANTRIQPTSFGVQDRSLGSSCAAR